MDLEKMKKMNSLMKELQKHGFAENSTEAYSQTEEMFNKHPQEAEIEGGLVQVEAPQTVQVETTQASPVNSDYLLQQRFDMQLNDMQRKYDQEAVYNNDLVAALAKEIVDMKRQVELLQQAKTVKNAVRKVVAEQEQVHFKKEFKEPHPMQGNVTPEDVAVDKIFYFGNK